MAHQLKTNTSTLQSVLEQIRALPNAGGGDITVPLAELNAVNGGTAVTTIEAAVDNTEALVAEETSLIGQINTVLDELGAGSSNSSGDGTVETYTLQINPEGSTFPVFVSYLEFVDNQYYYHQDNLVNNQNYPIIIQNVVLKTPIYIGCSGGVTPSLGRVNQFDYITPKDYFYENSTLQSFGEGDFVPLTTDENGYIIVRCYDDD